MATRWICPHCEHAAVITHESSRSGAVGCTIDSADGNWATYVSYVVCPNPECKLTTIRVVVGNGIIGQYGVVHWSVGANPKQVRIRPASYAKPIPEYVPRPVREDYEEACAIIDLSPKAAATLARRALQGMIRDFHGISKPTLSKEIEALRDHVDPLTWKAIDAIRGMGNIGAHMEKDIDTIVDVEPAEAERLVRLIEMLVREWYVARYNREQELAAIIGINADKQALRRGEALRPELGGADESSAGLTPAAGDEGPT